MEQRIPGLKAFKEIIWLKTKLIHSLVLTLQLFATDLKWFSKLEPGKIKLQCWLNSSCQYKTRLSTILLVGFR